MNITAKAEIAIDINKVFKAYGISQEALEEFARTQAFREMLERIFKQAFSIYNAPVKDVNILLVEAIN